MSSHLVALGKWSVWRWACLRATGFPARLVLDLADAELVGATDRFVEQDRVVARAREQLIAACKAVVDGGDAEMRKSIQRALKRLWAHKVPEAIADPAAEAARGELAAAVSQRDTCSAELDEAYARAQRTSSHVLRRIGADDRFRQALLWQNRIAVHTGIDWLLRQPIEATDSETRKNERMVASYLQRYCVKNDTIGFFGPVGWAQLSDSPVAITQDPGTGLLASRTVYFEYWAIDALAAKLSLDSAIRPFIAPRLMPRFRLEGTTLHSPIARQNELPDEFAAVVARCDGQRTARQIAIEVAGEPELGTEDDVLAVLDELVRLKIISWTLEIPTHVIHADAYLAELLARIEDADARRAAEAMLTELQAHRAEIATCTDAAQLDAALAAFETAFTRATDADSRRAHGQTYAGRTPLYEDCRRSLEVQIGRPVLDRLAPPLALLLASARWFTYEIATRYRRELAAIYERCIVGDDRVVDFAKFWQHIPALFSGARAEGSIVGAVRDELQRLWASALAIDPEARTVERSASVMAETIATSFAAPGPGWPAARHHSPDIMIAAADTAAIDRGDYCLVVGELHSGFNTVMEPLFLKQNPNPGELIAAREVDVDLVCIAPVWSKAVTRGDYYSMSERDLDLETGETRSVRPRSHVVATSDLVVEARDGYLKVRTRDGAHELDIIAFLEHHLIAESFSSFSPIASATHSPRVTIDGVVIAREAWRITPVDAAWASLKEPVARFAAARRWARALGMPRWVFVKTVEEVKPVYVDFDSPLYVETLAKQLRSASAASLSEMLPRLDESWVVDGDGERYTGELRIAAVDPVAWTSERCLEAGAEH